MRSKSYKKFLCTLTPEALYDKLVDLHKRGEDRRLGFTIELVGDHSEQVPKAERAFSLHRLQ